ncbi:glycosyltransferase [Streptomyces sp. URMC 124]|uniref:glycosyltransferase n=1 Tax=Streptomyces sp. URMC 124 TaxID=3423405 RepID=UPI003F1DC52D
MKILFVGGNGAGTLFPLVPLAQATRNAGHEVLVSGCEAVVPMILDAGLPAVAVTRKTVTDCRTAPLGNAAPVSEAGLDSFIAIGRMFGGFAASCLGKLLELADAWRPDLVVGGVLAYAAPLVARHARVPYVRFGIDMGEPLVTSLSAAIELAPQLERYGLEALPEPDLALSACPPGIRPVHAPPSLPVRHVPYTSQRPVEPWMHRRGERPRVLVSAGSRVTPDHDFDVLQGLVRKVAALDVDLLIAAPEAVAGMLRALPGGVLPERAHVGWIPLDVAVPGCDVMVHHGGGSTTLTGLAHGVPQILIPHIPGLDYPARMAGCGAAKLIRPEDDSAENIAAGICEVLGDPSYRRAAGRLREEVLAMPAPPQVVGRLERLAAGERDVPGESPKCP